MAKPIFPTPFTLIQAPCATASSQNCVPKTGSLNIPHSYPNSEMNFSSCPTPNPLYPSRTTPNPMFSFYEAFTNSAVLPLTTPTILNYFFSDNVINHFYPLSSLLKYKFHWKQEHLTHHSIPFGIHQISPHLVGPHTLEELNFSATN